MDKKTFSILTCLLFLTQAPLISSPVSSAPVSAASPGCSFGQEGPARQEFRLSSHERKILDIEIPSAGILSVEANWQGQARTLALILNGPGQAQAFSRKDGASPLTLTFKITEEMLKSGHTWKISLVNFNKTGSAEGEIAHSFSPGQSPQPSRIRPHLTQEEPKQTSSNSKTKEKTQPSAPTAGKSLSTKYFEIQNSRGYSKEELNQIRSNLQSQKRQLLKTRLEQRIEKLSSENRLAPILLPLVFQQIEGMSASRTAFRNADIRSHFREISETFKAIREENGSRYFRQNSTAPSLRSKSSRIQLGREIIAAVDPHFEQKIREAVRQSLSGRNPRFSWQKSQRTVSAGKAVSPSSRQAPKTKLSAADRNQLTAVLNSLARSGGAQERAGLLGKLRSFLQDSDFLSHQDVHVQEKLNPKDFSRAVPDLNSVHNVVNYCQYKVEFNRFTCISKNEGSHDEVYFITQTMLPRFDSQDMAKSSELGQGKLYNVNTRATGTYGGISANSTVGFRPGEKLLFWQNLYNTRTVFTVDLWEEDYSKSQVVAGVRDAEAQLRQALSDQIKGAVFDAIEDMLETALGEVLPGQVVSLIHEILSGQFDESTFDKIQSSLGGLQSDFFILSMLFSGKSFADVINFLSAGNPEIYLVVLAVEVCGPVLVDFFQGDWEEGFRALLSLPLSIFESVIGIFSHLDDFFADLMAFLDPDDHIQKRTVTIVGDHASLGEDADWVQTNAPGGGGTSASGTPGRKQLRSAPTSIQPELWFFGSGAFYKLFYNVSRELYGGKDVFGYTLKPDKGVYAVEKKYRVKSPYAGDKIRVNISVVNTLDVPFVYLSGPGGANGNFNGEREFEVAGFHDSEYTLTVAYLGSEPIYGFISLEENNDAQPERADSGGSADYSGGGGRNKNNKNVIR
jgi:hypothetical protein